MSTENSKAKSRGWLALASLALALIAQGCFTSPNKLDVTTVQCQVADDCPAGYECKYPGRIGGCCKPNDLTCGTGIDASPSDIPGPISGLDAPVDAWQQTYDGALRDGAELAQNADAQDVPISMGNEVGQTQDGLSSLDTTDAPLPGTGGMGGAGVGGTSGTGGVPGSGGSASSAGGAPGSGGVVSSGGITASGGAVGSGGTVATGGMIGTGGLTGTGGATCQPKARDCTSSADNNCNGTPDNQETTYCACPLGQSRACQEHPGYDGVGICKAGSQTCAASADKTTSSWGTCTGAVGPSTEVCDAAGLDENCNGQSNEGCACVNGASIPCDCGPATTCTNGQKGICSVSKVTLYRDSDGDGYGDPARPAMVCPGTAGYVSNNDDCDDSNSAFKPGISVCATNSITRNWCVSGGGGVTNTEACDQGCYNGICRTDGTVGLPGYVTCGSFRCLTSDGCNAGGCGGSVACDGPSDCSTGDVCWTWNTRDGTTAACLGAGQGGDYVVCDPMANTCNCKLQELSPGISLYVCP